MKTMKVILYLIVMLLSIISCKNPEKKDDLNAKVENSKCNSKTVFHIDSTLFGKNDIIVNIISRDSSYVNEVEVIVKLDNRVHGVEKVEDFNIIYVGCGYFNFEDNFISSTQLMFEPTQKIMTSFYEKTQLISLSYYPKKSKVKYDYLIINLNIFNLKFKQIDGLYTYFHLRDTNRFPILRINTDPFFYRSKKAEKLKLYEDTSYFLKQ